MTSHLGGAYAQGDENTIMPDVWGYLLVKYDLKSVLDVGCGFGHAVEWFVKHGVYAVAGIDGWDEAIRGNRCPERVVLHDFTTGPAPVTQSFDLAWSAEFLEHVEEQYLPNIFTTLRLCRRACVTHAEPGQAGYHHVNCQTSDYWIQKFQEQGFQHLPEETALLRRTDQRRRAPYGRRTLMMFERLCLNPAKQA